MSHRGRIWNFTRSRDVKTSDRPITLEYSKTHPQTGIFHQVILRNKEEGILGSRGGGILCSRSYFLFSLSPREEIFSLSPREEMCPFVLFPGESMTFCPVPHIRVKYTPRLIYGPISTSVHTRKMRVFYSPYHHERKCVRL